MPLKHYLYWCNLCFFCATFFLPAQQVRAVTPHVRTNTWPVHSLNYVWFLSGEYKLLQSTAASSCAPSVQESAWSRTSIRTCASVLRTFATLLSLLEHAPFLLSSGKSQWSLLVTWLEILLLNWTGYYYAGNRASFACPANLAWELHVARCFPFSSALSVPFCQSLNKNFKEHTYSSEKWSDSSRLVLHSDYWSPVCGHDL